MEIPEAQPYRHYLREWRERRGLLQEDLANMVGTSKSVVSRWEQGERHMKMAMQFAVCRALDITPGQLFASPDEVSIDRMLELVEPELRRRVVEAVKALIVPQSDN